MKAFLQQLTHLWKQLGLNQRVTLIVATVGLIAGLVALVVWSHRSQMQLLYGKLGEKDIAALMVVLEEQCGVVIRPGAVASAPR